MSATENNYTLDYIVKSCLMDIGENSTRYYQQYLNYAIGGFRRLNLAGMLPTTKTIILDIDSNTNTARLPSDYIDYLKVGLCIGCEGKGIGGFVNLFFNPDICSNAQDPLLNSVCECSEESLITTANNVGCGCTDGMQSWYYNPYYYNGGWFDGGYGFGAGFSIGGFNIFKEQNIIAFDSFVSGEKIILEYQSNGLAGSGTMIPEGAVGTLKAWVHWQRVLFSNDRTTRLDIVPYKQMFNSEYLGFRARNASMTTYNWKEIYYRSMRQTPKR